MHIHGLDLPEVGFGPETPVFSWDLGNSVPSVKENILMTTLEMQMNFLSANVDRSTVSSVTETKYDVSL